MSDMCCGVEMEGFEGRWYQHPILKDTMIALLLTAAAFALGHLNLIPEIAGIILFGIAIIIGGRHWSMEALEKLVKKRVIGIELLMLGATIGSIALGMWDEAATLVVLYGAAEGMEGYTFAKTRASIRKLLDLAPKEARIRKNGQEIMVSAQTLQVGEIFIVKPGESLPTDGVIIKGRSSIDESPVTGESIPNEKEEGMKVFAATINYDGVLEVRVTTDYKNNTLAKMVHLVEESRDQKSKTQLFIESFGARYTPMVFLAAILLLLIPPFFGGSMSFWATKAVVLLVAAAPCALIMSTPVAVATGIGTAGKHGVLVKGGMHLEMLGKLKVVAFDKTGTLTRGKPEVTDMITLEQDEQHLAQLAYSLEQSSTHPLAQAIVAKVRQMKIEPLEIEAFKSLTGAGVQGLIKETQYYLGKPKLFEEMGIQSPSQVQKLEKGGKTVVLVGTQDKIIGIIGIEDQIRTESSDVIRRLHQIGIKVAMLTGDNTAAARAIAKKLDIDDVRAELKPEDKIIAIAALEKQYGPVAMIGDGINDAPALARASVGIAMGTAGTDAAIEAADVALMGDDLTKALYALELGKRSRGISKQNIVFSLLILVLMIPSALLGLITVTIAVAVHEAAEILAVLNGLRVGRLKDVDIT